MIYRIQGEKNYRLKLENKDKFNRQKMKIMFYELSTFNMGHIEYEVTW